MYELFCKMFNIENKDKKIAELRQMLSDQIRRSEVSMMRIDDLYAENEKLKKENVSLQTLVNSYKALEKCDG